MLPNRTNTRESSEGQHAADFMVHMRLCTNIDLKVHLSELWKWCRLLTQIFIEITRRKEQPSMIEALWRQTGSHLVNCKRKLIMIILQEILTGLPSSALD